MSDQPTDKPNGWLSSGIELDSMAHDDPAEALRIGLLHDQPERILGAFRLMDAAGREPELPFSLTLKLAEQLEQADMVMEAARFYRKAAESDLSHVETPEILFRSAWLLLGPAHRPEPGVEMLRYLAANYQSHARSKEAEKILEHWDAGDTASLAQSLKQAAESLGRGEALVESSQAAAQPSVQTDWLPTGAPPAKSRQLVNGQNLTAWRRLFRILSIAFGVILAVYVVTFFARNRYQGVNDINFRVLRPPEQTEVNKPKVIQFTYGGYRYTLKPRHRYSISGLIVSKDDYTMLGLSRGNLFQLDLCMIWGSNVKSRVYQSSGLSFVHHGNVCYATYRGGVRFRFDELSNTHILTADEHLRDEFDSLGVGDQVHLEGLLVDVAVLPVKAGGQGIPATIRMKTSTTRTDNGRGACEILFARKLQVLAEASPLSRRLNRMSFWLLVLIGISFVFRLVFLPLGRPR